MKSMKSVLSLIFIFSIGGFAAFGQRSAPPPPPAPLIYKSPEKSELKEFTAEDKTFQITFPGVPQITKPTAENAATVTNYRVYRLGSNSLVTTTDFNFDVEPLREKVYEVVRSNALKTPQAKIEAEREIKIGDKSGREFDVLYRFQFQKIRVVFDGTRVYELKSDATNWHIIGEATKKQFLDETERFFGSFQINKKPEIAAEPVPADFLGTAEKSSYKNSFFGFSFEFPSDWIRLNDAEIQSWKEAGVELYKTENERVNRAFADAVKREVPIFAVGQNFANDAGTNLIVGVLKQPNSLVKAEAVARVSQKFFLTNPKILALKDVENVEINKVPLATFSLRTNIEGITIDQKIYVMMRKGYSISFVFSYRTADSLTAMEKILQSLKFEASK